MMDERVAARGAARRSRSLERLNNPRAMRPLAWAIVGVVCLSAVIVVAGFQSIAVQQNRLHRAQVANQDLRTLLIALIDSETGVRGYIISGKPEYLEPYHVGSLELDTLGSRILPEVDAFARSEGRTDTATQNLGSLRKAWNTALLQAARGALGDAQSGIEKSLSKPLMDRLRLDFGGLLASRERENELAWERIGSERNWIIVLDLLGGAVAVAALIYAFDRSIRDAARRLHAVRDNTLAARQIKLLLVMAEMLQSAVDRDDANEVLRSSALQLLPDFDGALYVFNASRDRLDLSTAWQRRSSDAGQAVWPDHISPASCWALKRGKAHVNDTEPGALRCAHSKAIRPSLEIPMSARGEIYGLLEVVSTSAEAQVGLEAARPIVAALADSMSLALSSISLREKLRNQALRDPLTGLYNRRFLEEMLERLAADTERRRTSFSAIMLDLDHFKTLNDQFGHATGDAVLRQVANVILATIRTSDVACRYGGEEIAILMPDCDLDVAMSKAELIRSAILGASKDGRLPSITASLGVASLPETSGRPEDLLTAADAALYVSKQQGRDRSTAAPLRMHGPMLVKANQ